MRKLILLCLLGAAFGQTRHTVPNLDTDNTFTGKNQFTKGAVLGPVAFANLGSLGAPQTGTAAIISDGSPGLVCAGGGTGIIAVYLNGAWNCSVSSGSAASFSSPPPLGNTTPNTVAGTVVNIVGSGLFFSAQPTCLFGESDNTLDEFEDVAGIPMWLPQGALGPCSQFLTYTPLPVGITPTDKQVPAWNAATGQFTIQTQAGGTPGGSNGQIQYNNAGALGGYTMSGDCTLVPSTGVITCTKTNGTGFGALATITPGTGVATFLTTPSSANLLSALTTKTGTGNAVFGTAPTISSAILSTAAQLSYITGSTQCLHVDTSGNITGTGSDCGAAGATAWSAIGTPAGNLALTMAANTSTFNTTSAVSQFFKWANTTAALVGASQSSPILSLCGTEFHAAASAEGCLAWQFIPGTGTDAANTFAFTHTGSATGATTTTFPGPIQAGSPGGAGGTITLPEGTTATASTGNDVCYGDSTAHAVKCAYNNGTFQIVPLISSTTTTVTQVLHATATAGVFAPSAIVVADLPSAIPIGNIGSAGLSGTAPVAISAAGAISVSAIPLASLATQAANTTVANVTAGSAAPTAAAIPSGIQNYVAGTGYNQATSHQVGASLVCADSSASSTAQSCTTSPSFTPAANDCVIYTTTTANTGAGLTLNVNALGAKSVAKWQGTTTLAANDVLANKQVVTCYDGTNWELSTVGNAPNGLTSQANATLLSNVSGGAAVPSANALPVTLNALIKTSTVNGALAASLTTDDGTTSTYTGTGGSKSPAFTSTGTTAGFADYPQGTTSAAVAPCNTATSICEQAPASVTSYVVTKPGAAPAQNGSLRSITTAGVESFVHTIPANTDPNGGISNFNQAAQSQVVVSATEYYITRSDLDMPAVYSTAIAAGTTMRWRIALTKTAAGTGTFQILLKKGTNGSTADTSIVTQTIGTQTAAADNMECDVQLTWTSATAAYWTIIPRQSAASGTGFGLVYPAAAAQFSGTISAQTTTTASDKYGLSVVFTTGTPTFVVNLVTAQAFGVN